MKTKAASANGTNNRLKDVEPATTVTIPEIAMESISLRLVGTAPLIVHRFPAKALREILEKNQGKTQPKKREPRGSIEEEVWGALYHLGEIEPAFPGDEEVRKILEGDSVQFGFPSVAVKAAIVNAVRLVDGLTMTTTRQAIHVSGAVRRDLMVLEGRPTIREDFVRIDGGRTASVRYRPQWIDWAAEIVVRWPKHLLSVSQICQLINLAGECSGLGEWRPQKGGGVFGTFEIAKA